MIAIVDYGMGNLRSVANAFRAIDKTIEISIIDSPHDLEKAEAIVLPGVGAFDEGMNNLREAGFLPALNREVQEKKKPFLGICLGMQFLSDKSEECRLFPSGERGFCHGLGWIHGTVREIETGDKKYKVPHMGWNDLQIKQTTPLYENFPEAPVFYFVHSYHFEIAEQEKTAVSAVTHHGIAIVASVQKENIYGVQFHPEKSQRVGLQLLKNFVTIANSYAEKTAHSCLNPS